MRNLAEDIKKGCGKEFEELGKATKGMFAGSIISYSGECRENRLCPECKSHAKAYLQAFLMEVEFLENLPVNRMCTKEDKDKRLQNLKKAILILQDVLK